MTKCVTKNATGGGAEAEAVVGAAAEAAVGTDTTENTAERGLKTGKATTMETGERKDPNLALAPVQLALEGITDMFVRQEVRNVVREKLLPSNEWAWM